MAPNAGRVFFVSEINLRLFKGSRVIRIDCPIVLIVTWSGRKITRHLFWHASFNKRFFLAFEVSIIVFS